MPVTPGCIGRRAACVRADERVHRDQSGPVFSLAGGKMSRKGRTPPPAGRSMPLPRCFRPPVVETGMRFNFRFSLRPRADPARPARLLCRKPAGARCACDDPKSSRSCLGVPSRFAPSCTRSNRRTFYLMIKHRQGRTRQPRGFGGGAEIFRSGGGLSPEVAVLGSPELGLVDRPCPARRRQGHAHRHGGEAGCDRRAFPRDQT